MIICIDRVQIGANDGEFVHFCQKVLAMHVGRHQRRPMSVYAHDYRSIITGK